MKKFKVIPLSRDYANRIRKSGKDDFGHPVQVQIATGKGPCRVSLRPFDVGKENRMLISHSPFTVDNAFDQPGPIFIRDQDVEEYSDVHRFPPEIKNDKEHFKITLIGYDKRQMMVYTKLVGDRDIDEMIGEIFENKPQVEYLHARSAEACCFICKIERAVD